MPFLCLAIGFNVETVTYKNLKFQVWDLGGQTSIRYEDIEYLRLVCFLVPHLTWHTYNLKVETVSVFPVPFLHTSVNGVSTPTLKTCFQVHKAAVIQKVHI